MTEPDEFEREIMQAVKAEVGVANQARIAALEPKLEAVQTAAAHTSGQVITLQSQLRKVRGELLFMRAIIAVVVIVNGVVVWLR